MKLRRLRPSLSVVVVVHDMARELPRTLSSISPDHQRGIGPEDYEVIVVDNGSHTPVEARVLDGLPSARVERVDRAPASPARAANVGLGQARGDVVGLIIDGARLASPGLFAGALRARALARRPVITAPAFHLGPARHMHASEVGYDQRAEDELLACSGWTEDGYRLFEISTLAGSSGRGLFGPTGESSSLFAPRPVWDELGGLDERFELPGGGLVNHDLFRRACGLSQVELIVLLGEGTFHQFHGGAATSRRLTWDDMHDDYVAVRGVPFEVPQNAPVYVGSLRPAVLPHVEQSARQAIRRAAKRRPDRMP